MHKKRKVNPFLQLKRQKALIERDFDCFKCKIKGSPGKKYIECLGKLQPSKESRQYVIFIKYDVKKSPSVYVVKPNLPLDIDVHMYSDGTLCLYYPDEDPWKQEKNIANTIIPWTAEWLVYYELYQLTGEWLGPSVGHGDNKDNLKDT